MEKFGKPIDCHGRYNVGMPHCLKAMFSVCLSRSAGSAIEAISLALDSRTSVWHISLMRCVISTLHNWFIFLLSPKEFVYRWKIELVTVLLFNSCSNLLCFESTNKLVWKNSETIWLPSKLQGGNATLPLVTFSLSIPNYSMPKNRCNSIDLSLF